MDTRRLILAMILAMAFVLGWQYFVLPMLYPGWDPRNRAPAATQPVEIAIEAPSTAPAVLPASQPVVNASVSAPVNAQALRFARGSEDESPVKLGSVVEKDPTYALGMTLDPRGAAIESVTLNQFRFERTSDKRYVFQTSYPNFPDTNPLATRTIYIDDKSVDVRAAEWNLESAPTQTSAIFYLDILRGETPVLRVRKMFTIKPASDPSKGYEVEITHSFENRTDTSLKVGMAFNGPSTPPPELDRPPDRQFVLARLEDAQTLDKLTYHAVESWESDKTEIDMSVTPLIWMGASGAYFEAILLPDLTQNPPGYITSAKGWLLNPAARQQEHAIVTVLETARLEIPAAQSKAVTIHSYFGPKMRQVLNEEYYALFPRDYDRTLLIESFCSFCVITPVIDTLVLLLRGFHFLFRDWGIAIICLVIVVRLILHPITKKSTVSMHQAQKLGPQLERLREKYKDDKDELNRQQIALYKEQGMTPILGCLPMLLQMPIWIALWNALNSTFELRHATFLWGLTGSWISDLARPDQVINWPPFKFLFFEFSGLHLLPILIGIVFYFQAKLQPKPVTMTKEQEQQQKMMQIMMPILFPLLFYNGPSGLNLYILTSTGIGILESRRIRAHIKEREEAEKAGKIIVDAKPTRAGRKLKSDASAAPTKPAGGIMGWLANLQAKAEELRQDADKQKKKKQN